MMKCKYCDKPFLAREMCSAHYNQWRKHGDPLHRSIAKRGEPIRFLSGLLNQRSDDCVIWPFKSRYANGYGSLWFKGRLTGAHRAVCFMAHGNPERGQEAAHICGERLCVNPRHIRWASAVENAADKLVHGRTNEGEKNPMAKLTEDDVARIRRMLADGDSHTSIAEQFRVSRRAIRLIASYSTWKHVTLEPAA